jgi:hypothetical protein
MTTQHTTTGAADTTAARQITTAFIRLGLFGPVQRATRRRLFAVFPDGTEKEILRQRGGYYNGPRAGQGCAPLSYAKQVWRSEGARIVTRSA